VILCGFCLLKKAISCGCFFASGLKLGFQLFMQVLAGGENFNFNTISMDIPSVRQTKEWI
jgi:hypothetical protein